MIEKKHCEYCKKIFRPKRKTTRFCSKPCSMRWHWNIHPDFRKRVSKSASDAKLGCTLSTWKIQTQKELFPYGE